MALNAATVWEVRTTGDDTNGGGWYNRTAGTSVDYTQQDAAQLSLTDLACASNTTLTSATGGFTAAMVGSVIRINSGTNAAAGYYEITARTDTNTVTIDRTCATGGNMTGGAGKVGGALASPGMAGGAKVAGNDVFIKYSATAYAITSTTANVAGGRVNDTTGGVDATNPTYWIGYDTTRTINNTDANRPTLQASGSVSSFTLFTMIGQYTVCRQMIFDGASKTTTTGFLQSAHYQNVSRLKAINCTAIGLDIQGGHGVSGVYVHATGCSGTAGIRVGNTSACVITDSMSYANGTHGFSCSLSIMSRCISYGNTGTAVGFYSSSVGMNCISCVSYGNAGAGFDAASSVGNSLFLDCIGYGNTGAGFSSSSVRGLVQLINCAGASTDYSATNITNVYNWVTLTGSPFNDAANGDFSLISTGEGAKCRAAGSVGAFPGGLTTGYLDIGAVQHADPAGGGTTVIVIED